MPVRSLFLKKKEVSSYPGSLLFWYVVGFVFFFKRLVSQMRKENWYCACLRGVKVVSWDDPGGFRFWPRWGHERAQKITPRARLWSMGKILFLLLLVQENWRGSEVLDCSDVPSGVPLAEYRECLCVWFSSVVSRKWRDQKAPCPGLWNFRFLVSETSTSSWVK